MPPIKTCVITRPREDAKPLASDLRKNGIHSLIEPMLFIEPLHENEPLLKEALKHKPDALIVTSKHAVSVLAAMTEKRQMPLIAVGKATSLHAQKLGFKNVTNAGGNASLLTTYIIKHIPKKSHLLYLCGKEVSKDIATILKRRHFIVDTIILYQAILAPCFSTRLRKAISQGNIDAVLFFSERTAATYIELALRHKLSFKHQNITAVSLSKAIAKRLIKLPWKAVYIAAAPEAEAMLNKVNSL